jgi:hypothetical protein
MAAPIIASLPANDNPTIPSFVRKIHRGGSLDIVVSQAMGCRGAAAGE